MTARVHVLDSLASLSCGRCGARFTRVLRPYEDAGVAVRELASRHRRSGCPVPTKGPAQLPRAGTVPAPASSPTASAPLSSSTGNPQQPGPGRHVRS